jgi:hypothetical protein
MEGKTHARVGILYSFAWMYLVNFESLFIEITHLDPSPRLYLLVAMSL